MPAAKNAPVVTGERRAPIAIFTIFAACLAMNLALFLHPMSPRDFIDLACSDPLATLFDQQGMPMAVLFWSGLVAMLAAFCMLLRGMALDRMKLQLLHGKAA